MIVTHRGKEDESLCVPVVPPPMLYAAPCGKDCGRHTYVYIIFNGGLCNVVSVTNSAGCNSLFVVLYNTDSSNSLFVAITDIDSRTLGMMPKQGSHLSATAIFRKFWFRTLRISGKRRGRSYTLVYASVYYK